MKSLLSIIAVAGSALIASSSLTNPSSNAITKNAAFFTCDIDGKGFTAKAADSSLAVKVSFANIDRSTPAAFLMIAEKRTADSKSYFYIQPLNDDAPMVLLTAHNNLYQDFYITYKAADNTFYNTTTAPGNLEITAIDTIQKVISGKLNCILYSSTKKDWIIITNGRFRVRY